MLYIRAYDAGPPVACRCREERRLMTRSPTCELVVLTDDRNLGPRVLEHLKVVQSREEGRRARTASATLLKHSPWLGTGRTDRASSRRAGA